MKSDHNSEHFLDLIKCKRDPELEKTIGSLITAGHHMHRIQRILDQKTNGYVHLTAGYYYKRNNKKSSTYRFNHNGKRFKISIEVDQIEVKGN